MYTENSVSSVSIFTFFSVTLCMILGVTGNVMVLYYYTQFVNEGSLRVLAIAMASLDLLSCLALMPMQIYLTSFTYMFRAPSEETCQVFWGLQTFVVCACAWLLASWTYEMQRKVFIPFPQPTIDQRRVLLEVAGAVAVAITASIPAVLLSGVTSHVEYLQNPRLIAVCFVAQRFLGRPWALVYHGTITTYLIGATCFIVAANMRISSAVFRVSDSSCSLGFTASQDSLSKKTPPPAHSIIQMPPSGKVLSEDESVLSERHLTHQASIHPEPSYPAKLPSKLEPSPRQPKPLSPKPIASFASTKRSGTEASASRCLVVLLLQSVWARVRGRRNLLQPVSPPEAPPSSLPPPPPPHEEEKNIGEISRWSDSTVAVTDFHQRERSGRPTLTRDPMTLQQVRSSACCTLCLISLLVVVQFLPFSIFILDTAARGSAGVKRLWSANTSIVLQLIYRSFFIGCAVNSYVLFVSDKRFRLCLARFQLQIRNRENAKFLRPLTLGNPNLDRWTRVERMGTNL